MKKYHLSFHLVGTKTRTIKAPWWKFWEKDVLIEQEDREVVQMLINTSDINITEARSDKRCGQFLQIEEASFSTSYIKTKEID